MTVEFGEDVVQAHAWRLKGVGMYGSDVDVVSVELYRELAANQKNTMETLTRWAESAHKSEKRAARLEAAIQRHLDTFGYDNHEGLADALADEEHC